jgi:hypothetical protein
MTPLSDWLDFMLEEIERKKQESESAANEQVLRSQEKYPENSPERPVAPPDNSVSAGSGTEL